MSIWGRRDGEPPAEEAHESQAGAHDTQEPAAENQAGEPRPAFWRAQGEAPTSPGRDPADAPPPAYGHAPAMTGSGEPVVTGAEPAVTGVHEPAMGRFEEPVVTDTEQPAATEAFEPAAANGQEPAVTGAPEPAVTGAGQAAAAPAVPVAAASADAAAVTASPGGISAERWSEILVAFVDDPRGSVQMAADAVVSAIDEFVNSIRARQHDLASTWQGGEAGTEQFRTALLEYRKLGQRVQHLDLGERVGA